MLCVRRVRGVARRRFTPEERVRIVLDGAGTPLLISRPQGVDKTEAHGRMDITKEWL